MEIKLSDGDSKLDQLSRLIAAKKSSGAADGKLKLLLVGPEYPDSFATIEWAHNGEVVITLKDFE